MRHVNRSDHPLVGVAPGRRRRVLRQACGVGWAALRRRTGRSHSAPLYQLGTRCIQLTYNLRNLLGDGCTERTNAGLSDFGVAVVERMNAPGIVVDLSHSGEQTSRDGIAFSKRPPAFTHTMCRAIYDHVRAKPDDLAEGARR